MDAACESAPSLAQAVIAGEIRARGGIAVAGIELSPHMAERLRAKPGAETVPVTIGDI